MAQPVIKLRPILGLKGDAGHFFRYSEPVNNQYYHFKKIPLSIQPFPLLQMGITVELQFKNKTSLQLGIIGNEGAGAGYKLGIQKNIIASNTGYTEVYGTFGASHSGITVTKFPLWINREIYTNREKSHGDTSSIKNKWERTKRKFFSMELVGGINYIHNWPTENVREPVIDVGFSSINHLGDTVRIYHRTYSLNKEHSLSFVGGVNFKLFNAKKELLCASLYYEQGTYNLARMDADVYIKNLHFNEFIYTRGSSLHLNLSFPIRITGRKKL